MNAIATPPPQQPVMTLDEFCEKHSGDRVEFINGQVVELPMPQGKHGKISYRVTKALGDFVDANDLGHIAINDSFVRVSAPGDPTRVRGVDVSYYSYARIPKGPFPEGLLDVSPELIFEVMSPSDLWTEVFAKVEEYLASGVLAVVVLNTDKRTATVCRPGPTQQDFFAADTLTLPDVLPGFAVPVARLFD